MRENEPQTLEYLAQRVLRPLAEFPRGTLRALLYALPKLLRRAPDVLVRACPLPLHALALPPLRRRRAQCGLALHRGVDEARVDELLLCLLELCARDGHERRGVGFWGRFGEDVEEYWEGEEEQVADYPEVVVPLITRT